MSIGRRGCRATRADEFQLDDHPVSWLTVICLYGQQEVHYGQPRLACLSSCRAELEIGALRPGTAPEDVIAAAVTSFGSLHVDATDLKVSDGIPFILVRFTVPAASEVEEYRVAGVAARRVRAAVERVAGTFGCRGADWVPIS